MTEEYIHGMSDAVVRKMPTNEDFREALKYFGLGWYAERQIGVSMSKFLAHKWNIVLVENEHD